MSLADVIGSGSWGALRVEGRWTPEAPEAPARQGERARRENTREVEAPALWRVYGYRSGLP